MLSAVAIAALLWLLLAAAERALALAQRFEALPAYLQWTLGLALLAFAVAAAAIGVWLLKPRRRRVPVPPPSREAIESRIQQLQATGANTAQLSGELGELDRRHHSGRLYVAVYGEVSTGKSSLINALAPQATRPTDARAGTTRAVSHHDGILPDGRSLTLADVPGSQEVDGEARQTLARDEALRSHAVIYVCAGDLNRRQAEELHALAEVGKPLLLVLNKTDQWTPDELAALITHLRQQAGDSVDAVLATCAGGEEHFRRERADGTIEHVRRARTPQIAALTQALLEIADTGAVALEPGREQAVLSQLHQATGTLEVKVRSEQAEAIVSRYARRAVVGALAAIAPGSDLVIQGALATAMARELATLYQVRLSDLEIEAFLKQARLTLRTSTSLVLAIAGNALKAFPGLGTLGGGMVHAVAYALIFDSMGKALAATLAERQQLDQDTAAAHLRAMLGAAGPGRLKRLAALTREALAEPRDEPPPQLEDRRQP
nr:GTPase [Oleiagrimonas sp. C23AA]